MKKILLVFTVLVGVIFAQDEIKLLSLDENNESFKIKCLNTSSMGIAAASVEINGTVYKLETFTDLSTVIYILVDSSSPMKHAYKKGIRQLLKENIPKFIKNDMQVIISTFDKNLKHVYNSEGNNTLQDKLSKIQILGQTTELWRNTKEALKELHAIKKERKILLLVSDGDAEDTPAYTLKDVVNYAKETNVRIASLIYRARTDRQNLIRIAEDTAGKIWEADKKTHRIDKDFYKRFNDFINAQFMVSFPKDILNSSLTGEQEVQINFSENNTTKQFLIKLVTKKLNTEQSFWEKNKLYLLIGLACFLLLLLFLLLKPKKEIEEEIKEDRALVEEPIVPIQKAIAFLDSMGGTKHEIFKFPSTIGKKESNDVVIDGQYVSRNHAVLDKKDGLFYLTDINSANGTKVNNERIEGTIQIRPKDKIEFGPYKTVFILN